MNWSPADYTVITRAEAAATGAVGQLGHPKLVFVMVLLPLVRQEPHQVAA